jgi:hypothetical protein
MQSLEGFKYLERNKNLAALQTYFIGTGWTDMELTC